MSKEKSKIKEPGTITLARQAAKYLHSKGKGSELFLKWTKWFYSAFAYWSSSGKN